MQQQGRLTLYSPSEAASHVSGSVFGTQQFWHQTSKGESLLTQGWDPAYRSGVRRLFGDGIYFASPKKFWPSHPGLSLCAYLNVAPAAHQSFEEVESLSSYLRGLALNVNSDRHQPAIAAHFLQKGTTCVSFPEDIGEDAVLNNLLGTPNRTYVVYDAQAIVLLHPEGH